MSKLTEKDIRLIEELRAHPRIKTLVVSFSADGCGHITAHTAPPGTVSSVYNA
jgi:hypothetical protein